MRQAEAYLSYAVCQDANAIATNGAFLRYVQELPLEKASGETFAREEPKAKAGDQQDHALVSREEPSLLWSSHPGAGASSVWIARLNRSLSKGLKRIGTCRSCTALRHD